MSGHQSSEGGKTIAPASGDPARNGNATVGAIGAQLPGAVSAVEACQVVADTLVQPGRAGVGVLLAVGNTLHCYAVGGTWRIYYSLPADLGVVGHAFQTGREAIEDPADPTSSLSPLIPLARSVVCAPIPGRGDTTIGVLKMELTDPTLLDGMRPVTRQAAALLGDRLVELGFSGREPPGEQLIRHVVRITSASDERDLVMHTLRAARELSGLDTAVGIREGPDIEPLLVGEPHHQTVLSERMRELTPEELAEIGGISRRYGSWFTSGPPERAISPAPTSLLRLGVRTAIAIPLGRALGIRTKYDRTLLMVDRTARRPVPTTIDLLEMLGTHAVVSLERIWLLDSLRARAGHDPLTGLEHQASLMERLNETMPERTAFLMVDVDKFKDINDTRGHAEGDRVLIELSTAMLGTLHPDDELYRVGGDEFVALAKVDSLADAERIGMRLLKAAHEVPCTVSVGVALLSAQESPRKALRRADAAMYVAKHEGRDRIHTAPDRPAASP